MWKKRLWRIFAPLFMMLVVCGFQTVVWPLFISSLPAPPLWLLLIVWVSLYREGRETILLVYAMGFLATSFTAMPVKMMLFSLLFIYLLVRRVKERVFWPGLSYFAITSLAAVAAFQVLYLVLSAILEPVRTGWLPVERLVIVLWTIPASFLVYPLMNAVERPGAFDPTDRERSYV